MNDDAILALAYLVAFSMALLAMGIAAEVAMFMGARRRRGGAIFKMAEPAARGALPPKEERR